MHLDVRTRNILETTGNEKFSALVALSPAKAASKTAEERFDSTLDVSVRKYKDSQHVLTHTAQMAKAMSRAAATLNPAITFPGMGGHDGLIRDYAIPGTMGLFVGLFQNGPQGQVNLSDPFFVQRSFASIDEATTLMRQEANRIGQAVFTNTDVNKDQLINIFSYTVSHDERLGWVYYLSLSKQFMMTKSADGAYHLPDFNTYELDLASDIVYATPGATFIFAECYYNPLTSKKSSLVFRVDSRLFPDGDGPVGLSLDPGHEYVSFRTVYAASGTNGPTLMDTVIFVPPKDHYYMGPMGEQHPVLTSPQSTDQQVTFDLTAGRNQTILVESAPTPAGPWTSAGYVSVPYDTSTVQFQGKPCGPAGSFRARVTTSE